MQLKVISGGQTGIDQAALRAAKRCGISTGGFAPKGYRTEIGAMRSLKTEYGLEEMGSSDYPTRTRANISTSHATLIVDQRDSTELTGGTLLTWNIVCDMRESREVGLYLAHLQKTTPANCAAWVQECYMAWNRDDVFVLNIAGPSESNHPGIGDCAEVYLMRVLTLLLPLRKV